ncbi:2-oxo acid dehydrogenase subunit E2 [Agromyces sp. GXQ0307]|uniref:2-oxo acid dehydrogenase subunit E2 n=1 Tax=Agromyces sp. GXQ0307 TaxID=3377835 RepID=UPI00383AD88C
MATVVRMPEVLTGVTEAAIQAWLVEPGQEVSVGTPLAEVETEKAVVEYAAESDGTVLRLLVEAGAAVAIGEPIAVIGEAGESVDDADLPGASTVVPTTPTDVEASASTPATGSAADPESGAPVAERIAADDGSEGDGATRRFASPIVRRLAREQGVDLSGIAGTGPGGRIVRRDLEAHAAGPAAATASGRADGPPTGAAPVVAAPAADDVEEIPLTPMRRAIARRVTESTTTVPHFFLTADCCVDELLELRRRVNEAAPTRVSLNDFVLKACAGAFADVPEANATWGGTVIRRHRSVDIAVAVSIDGGLLTPVVRGIDRLGLVEVAETVADLVERGRSGRLRQDELEGGSFSVSNLGMFGTAEFSAIISPPHAGILAVGAARRVPLVDDDGGLTVGSVMTVTLSADHRVIDGALAAQWMAAFVRRIEQPLSILL